MIDHTGVRVSDLEKSKAFYRAALAPLGYALLMEFPAAVTGGEDVAGFGVAPKPDFWLTRGAPYGAFVLDPDGHNVEAACHDAP